ncbi:MAG: hypothetical protein PWP23_859 [Candidatus Sumerlaeota bacterium]|nr:hypothetical protein [Candidatus Sumerlaeota bacterium]
MSKRLSGRAALVLAAALAATAGAHAQTPAPQEFRGAWISTVYGLDFPDAAGTSNIAAQRAKLVELIDRTQAAGCNAVLFQVRSECDAMYISNYEPWSRWLTGTQGGAPARPWDPLQFVIDESRRRGMEVHAWFNPYRAGVSQAASYHSTHPLNDTSAIVEAFSSSSSNYYWINPGHADTPTYTLNVIMDLVSRYDIDGVHFDDYFYPYGIDGSHPFPDTTEYNAYTGGGGALSLADWRRKNIDDFLAMVRGVIASEPGKEHVRFGISPFGIWDSGTPSGIAGLSAYDTLFADSRKWLQQGWVDYMAPQLYWGRAADGYSSAQDFDTLINWWSNGTQNPLGRHVFAGVSPSWITPASEGYDATDIVSQVTYTQSSAADGNIFFRTEMFTENSGAGRDGLNALLLAGPYTKEASPPAATWLDNTPPDEPTVAFANTGSSYTAYWTPTGSEYPQWYVVYWQEGSVWNHAVVPDWQRSYTGIPSGATDIAVQAVDRVGNRSTSTVISLAGASNPIPDQFTTTVFGSFESTELFTITAGTNTNVSASSPSLSTEEANNRLDPRVGAVGSQSTKTTWTFSSPGNGFYRLTTTPADPMIDLSQGLGVYVKLLSGTIDVSVVIRETGGSGPIGADGGISGTLERTAYQRVTASPNWQYLYFDIPNESYTAYFTGDGVLDGSWGVFDALGISSVDGNANFTLYVDDIHQGEPHTALGEPLSPKTASATTATGNFGVDLTWAASPAADLKGYRIYRSISPNVALTTGNLVAETGPVTTYADTGLTPNAMYYYVVTAVDHFGYESVASPETSASAATLPVEMDAFMVQ